MSASRAEAPRTLIVTADAFGMDAVLTRGIISAHRDGVVRATSLMVDAPAAALAAAAAAKYPRLDIGLHFDLGEWRCLDDRWIRLRIYGSSHRSLTAEVERQLDRFRELTGREPTHLDSFEDVHRKDPFRGVLIDVGDRLQIPVRHFSGVVRYCSDFIRSGITLEAVVRAIEQLHYGITELACRPPHAPRELLVLTDSRVRAALDANAVTLASFSEALGGPLLAGY